MKNLFTVNPEIMEKKMTALYYRGNDTQELYTQLIQTEFSIDAFCFEKRQYDNFIGKDCVTIQELIAEDSYALIVELPSYERILKTYVPLGLKEENVFIYINPKYELIYV